MRLLLVISIVLIVLAGAPVGATPVPAIGLTVNGVFPVDGEPTAIAAGDGDVWATTGNRSVVRLDAATGEVTATVPISGQPVELAFGEGALWAYAPDAGQREIPVPTPPEGTRVGEAWVAEAAVIRTDPGTARVTNEIPIGSPGGGLAVAHGAVWAGIAGRDDEPSALVRIDPATAAVEATIPIEGPGPQVAAVAAGEDGIWAAMPCSTCPGPGLVALVDPGTKSVVREVELEAMMLAGIAAMPGALWATMWDFRAAEPELSLARIDAATGRISQQPIDSFATRLAPGESALWLVDCPGATVTPLDPETGQPAGPSVTVGEPAPPGWDPWIDRWDTLSCPGSVAETNVALWVTVPGEGEVVRLRIDG